MVVIIMFMICIILFIFGIKKKLGNLLVLSILIGLCSYLIQTGPSNSIIDDPNQGWKLHRQIVLAPISNNLLTENSNNVFYVSLSKDNFYKYRYEINSNLGIETSKEYVVDLLSNNVEEIEDINCKIPLLLEYKCKFRISKWKIIIPGRVTKYEFYVPKGTINHEL